MKKILKGFGIANVILFFFGLLFYFVVWIPEIDDKIIIQNLQVWQLEAIIYGQIMGIIKMASVAMSILAGINGLISLAISSEK